MCSIIKNVFVLIVALGFLGCAPRGDTPSTVDLNSTPTRDDKKDNKQPEASAKPGVLQKRIEAALEHVRRRDLQTTHGFWTITHGILGLGMDVTLRNPDTGERVKAIDYIRTGGPVRGMGFRPTGWGLDVVMGPELTGIGQGHRDQFLAEVAQWGLPITTKFIVFNKEYTVEDFVRHSQMTARVTGQPKQELSWTLVVLSQYRSTNFQWTNYRGDNLHFTDLVRYELNESIARAACGGTHRLFGLTWAYYLHMQRGGKKEGVWKDVDDKIAKYVKKAREYQNPDGSFSTQYVSAPENKGDLERRIGTTGHVLEWLALALPDGELRKPWVERAASALSLMILQIQDRPFEGGSLYHATHALNLYHSRVFGKPEERAKKRVPLPPPEELPEPILEIIPE